MFKLTIEDDEGKTTVVPLARDEITIGRLEGNTIRLTERNVSRRHARLVRQNGALFIEDLSSFTGVRVNGTKIASPTPLREGDEVQIGDYRLNVRGEKPAAPGIADRPTMPAMTATAVPMGTVGGSVAIPTRASASMAVQPPAAPAVASPRKSPVAPLPAAAPASAEAAPAAATPSPPAPIPAPVFPPAYTPAPIPISPMESAAPEVSEAQPTIPIRTLGADVATGPAARLFVVTTELAGMEFPLERPSAVIGRTDENDVVLNHRSISRHHAKIVRDGDQYTIVDLQSANGVRVNGEDYERIELNPGDTIELGHVKLRFVGPRENFVFDPRAVRTGGAFPTKMLVAGVGVVLCLVAVYTLVNRGSRGGSTTVPPIATAPAPTPPPPPQPLPPAETAPAVPEAPPAVPTTPVAILAEAKDAAGAEDWEKARASLDKLGTTIADPIIRRDAIALRRKVDTERQAAVLFAQFDEASGAKNYAEAVDRYQEIPVDSVYKRRARTRYEEARTAVVAEHLGAAEKARAAGRCTEVRGEVDEIIKLDPRNVVAREMVRLCRPRAEQAPVAAARPAVRPRPALVAENRPEPAKRPEPRRAEATRPEPRGESGSDSEGPDPDALMKQAREAWLRQQCGSAIDLSRKALHAKPGMTDAYQIIAVCSCTLKDGEAAGRAYAKLDDKNRNLVRALCQKNGITVGE